MAHISKFKTTEVDVVNDLADHIKGKVVLTTGVSPGGLGAAFVESIAAAQPVLLILAGRGLSKVKETASTIITRHPDVKVRLLEVDLGSLAAVHWAAAAVQDWDDVSRIDVLVNNVGVMGIDDARCLDGFGMTLAVKYLGLFLFTNLGGDAKQRGPSLEPDPLGDYNFQNDATYERWQAYGQSKTANILMALGLAEKLGDGPKNRLRLRS